MTPSYSIGWLSAEYFAATADFRRWVSQTPFSCFTFESLISSRLENRWFEVEPPFVIQSSPAVCHSSSVEKAGALLIRDRAAIAGVWTTVFVCCFSLRPTTKPSAIAGTRRVRERSQMAVVGNQSRAERFGTRRRLPGG